MLKPVLVEAIKKPIFSAFSVVLCGADNVGFETLGTCRRLFSDAYVAFPFGEEYVCVSTRYRGWWVRSPPAEYDPAHKTAGCYVLFPVAGKDGARRGVAKGV